jgi:hypothetical protein
MYQKGGEIYQMTTKLPNDHKHLPNNLKNIPNDHKNIPNDHTNIPNDHTNIPNEYKIYQMAVIYSKWEQKIPKVSILTKALQNLPKLVFLV